MNQEKKIINRYAFLQARQFEFGGKQFDVVFTEDVVKKQWDLYSWIGTGILISTIFISFLVMMFGMIDKAFQFSFLQYVVVWGIVAIVIFSLEMVQRSKRKAFVKAGRVSVQEVKEKKKHPKRQSRRSANGF